MNVTDTIKGTAAVAIPQFRLGRISAAGTITLNGAGQVPHGINIGPTIAAVAAGDLWPRSVPGATLVTASGSITALSLIYPDAAGKVTATPTGDAIGLALQTASGDNAQIEAILFDNDGRTTLYAGPATGAAANSVTINVGQPTNRTRLQVQVRSNAGLDRGALTVTTSGNNVTIAAGTLAATDEVLIIQH